MISSICRTGLAVSLAVSVAFAAFDECKFNFGRMWSSSFSKTTDFSGLGLSHMAIWLGDNASYNQYWEGYMLTAAANNDLTPVIYAYVIAEYDKDNGLVDCDVGSPNHCTGGANMIRNHWSDIMSRYTSYASGIANNYGTSDPTIWLIEPDFLQYSVTGDSLNTSYSQTGGGIPDDSLCGYYFTQIVNTIKSYLPNAKIAVDISPWINDGLDEWYARFDQSLIDYAFTSGGRTQGNSTLIRSDNNNTVTWTQASEALNGKKIIADDGYGVGGSSTTDYDDWMSLSNINSRISDGVIGITIQEPATAYTTFAASNDDITIACNGTSSKASSSSAVSSSSVASSSSKASSSSVVSSSSRASSSSIVSSSSKVSSSSVASSSSIASSSSAQSSSSQTGTTAGNWTAVNASLTNATDTGISIGYGGDWNSERTVSSVLGTVNSGSTYTLSFDANVSTGGETMSVLMSLGSYCDETISVTSTLTNYTCTFTATATASVTLSLTVPASRWETLSLYNLSLVGPEGDIIGTSPIIVSSSATQRIGIRLRDGSLIQWRAPAYPVLQVYNLMGKRMLRSQSGSLNLANLPSGIYFISATNATSRLTLRVNNL